MKRSTRVKSWHENLIEFGERQTKRDVPILDSIWACGGVPVDGRQDGVFSKGMVYIIMNDFTISIRLATF